MKAIKLALSLLTAVLPLTTSLAAHNVVTDWNDIASTTIVAKGGNGPAPGDGLFCLRKHRRLRCAK